MRITVILCIAYWIMLTVLLLVPNPAALVGMHSVPIFPWGKFGIHLSFFIVLSLLVNFSRWPRRLSWSLIGLMTIYGVVTEILQLFDPPRTFRVLDGMENLLGIAIGSILYWLAWRLRKEEELYIPSEEDLLKLRLLNRIGRKRESVWQGE
jgi:hypothetical protein